MNYYFPYGMGYPFVNTPTRLGGGLFSRIFRNGINWSGILNGTQRTLNIINQTIPTIKQISPVVKNAKTMFKVMNEFKKVDNPVSKDNVSDNSFTKDKNFQEDTKKEATVYEQGPTFFV